MDLTLDAKEQRSAPAVSGEGLWFPGTRGRNCTIKQNQRGSAYIQPPKKRPALNKSDLVYHNYLFMSSDLFRKNQAAYFGSLCKSAVRGMAPPATLLPNQWMNLRVRQGR